MAMRFEFFTIPVIGGEDAAEVLNRLVGSVLVLSVDRQFVADEVNSCWAVCMLSQGFGQRPQGTQAIGFTPRARRPAECWQQGSSLRKNVGRVTVSERAERFVAGACYSRGDV